MSQNLFTCCLIMLIVMAGCSLSQAVITNQPQFHSNHKRCPDYILHLKKQVLSSLPQGNPPPKFLLLCREIPKEDDIGGKPFFDGCFKNFWLSNFLGICFSGFFLESTNLVRVMLMASSCRFCNFLSTKTAISSRLDIFSSSCAMGTENEAIF